MIFTPVIETRQLCKSYGEVDAVRDLDLLIEPNQITGFLGSHGAGKSTTIKMLLGMLSPTSGEGKVLGRNIKDPRDSVELRRRVAYVSEDKRLYGYMTVEQTIQFTRVFYPDWRPDIAADLLKKYDLPGDRKVKSLSKGMRTKLALLLAFSRRPALLILDEPSEGLDPHGAEQLLEGLIGSAAEATTVFFSTHQIEEVERAADRVCILDKGRVVIDAALDELRDSYRQIHLVFSSHPDEHELRLAGVESIHRSGNEIALFVSSNVDAVIERARELDATSIQVAPVSLRDIFLRAAKAG